jgi:hypothetical protein
MTPESSRVNKIPPLRTPRLKECAPDTVPETGCSDGRNDEKGLGDGVDCGAINLDEFDNVGVGLAVESLTGVAVGNIVAGLNVGSVVGTEVENLGCVGRSPRSGTCDGVGG